MASTHLKLYLVLMVVLLAVVPALTTSGRIADLIRGEATQIQRSMGGTYSNTVITQANSWHGAVFGAGPGQPAVKKLHVDDQVHNEPSLFNLRNLSSKTNDIVLNWSLVFYLLCLRLAIVITWLPYIAPFLAATVVHGFAYRKVKQTTIGVHSPVTFSLAGHGLITLILLPVVYFVVPFPLPPSVLTIWTVLVSFPMILAIRNVQRMNV